VDLSKPSKGWDEMRAPLLNRVLVAITTACSGCDGSTEPALTRAIEQGLCQSDPDNPCCPGSPIIIDLAGNGFDLTDVTHGVRFNLNPTGDFEQVSWTAPGSDDAWLALDRNGNGVIDDGTELFGNFTPQPSSNSRQGYLALGVFDLNRDDAIDTRDAIFAQLRLWQDRNHDGVSSANELATLDAHGIVGLGLRVTGERQTDEHGNLFRYSAHVFRAPGSRVGPLSYDVFLITELLDRQAREQGALQANGSVSMASVEPDPFCGGGGGEGGGITDPSIFYQYATIGGVVCRAVCWAAGSAVCAAVAVACAVGSTVTVGGLVIPCTTAIIAACAAGGGGASICSDLVCPAVAVSEE
jgi:hypothetical protein